MRVGSGPPMDALVVLYVGGFGRSGSTLLELMLGAAVDVTSMGEVVHLWRRGVERGELCGCGARFGNCPFWTEVGARAFGGWQTLDVTRMLELKATIDRQRYAPLLLSPWLPASLETAVTEYAAAYRKVYAAAAAVGGTGVVVDSSKHPSLAAVLHRDPLIDLRVVHLVRDSRGVAYSWSKEIRRPEDLRAETYMPRYSAAVSSGYWLAQNGLFHLLAMRGVPVLRLRYEDMVDDPSTTLAAVRRFAGLPASDPIVPVTEPAKAQHSVAGNPLRFATGPLRLQRDEVWRSALPDRDRRLVSALTAPLAARYGYLGQGHR